MMEIRYFELNENSVAMRISDAVSMYRSLHVFHFPSDFLALYTYLIYFLCIYLCICVNVVFISTHFIYKSI